MKIFNISNFNDKTNRLIQSLHSEEGNIKLAMQGSSQNIEIAHIDCEQRYTFIYCSQPDSHMKNMLGKRDDEIELNDGRIRLRELKRKVIETGVSQQANISFPDSTSKQTYHISVDPLYDDSERIIGATSISIDISEIKNTLMNAKRITGIVPLCSYCKDIRNDNGEWEHVDSYIYHHSEAMVSHGICPGCMEEHHLGSYRKTV